MKEQVMNGVSHESSKPLGAYKSIYDMSGESCNYDINIVVPTDLLGPEQDDLLARSDNSDAFCLKEVDDLVVGGLFLQQGVENETTLVPAFHSSSIPNSAAPLSSDTSSAGKTDLLAVATRADAIPQKAQEHQGHPPPYASVCNAVRPAIITDKNPAAPPPAYALRRPPVAPPAYDTHIRPMPPTVFTTPVIHGGSQNTLNYSYGTQVSVNESPQNPSSLPTLPWSVQQTPMYPSVTYVPPGSHLYSLDHQGMAMMLPQGYMGPVPLLSYAGGAVQPVHVNTLGRGFPTAAEMAGDRFRARPTTHRRRKKGNLRSPLSS